MARTKLNEEMVNRGLNFSRLVKEAREARGLTQGELASKASISIDTVRSIETSKIAAPSIFVAIDLAKALGVKWTAWVKQLEGKAR